MPFITCCPLMVPLVRHPSDEQRAPSPCSGDLWYTLLLFLFPQRVKELQFSVQLCKRRETDLWSLPLVPSLLFLQFPGLSFFIFTHSVLSWVWGRGFKDDFRCYPVFSGVRKEEIALYQVVTLQWRAERSDVLPVWLCGCRCNHPRLGSTHSRTKCRRKIISL